MKKRTQTFKDLSRLADELKLLIVFRDHVRKLEKHRDRLFKFTDFLLVMTFLIAICLSILFYLKSGGI